MATLRPAAVAVPVLPGLPAGVDSTDVVVQMVRRAASPGFESWWRKAENVGFCANPIHLSGTDTFGRQHQVVDPLQQPPRGRVPVVLGSVCPRHLAADPRRPARRTPRHARHRRRAPPSVRHLDRTQLRGRAHQPVTTDTVSTLAAVTIRAAADSRRCQHGKPLWCSTIHGDNDARVGQPLCEDCYDYTGHVLFAWHAPELWRRFTITLRRLLDSHLRAMGEAAKSVRLNYVKVAELQRRAIPHFHAVIRLDAPPVPGEPPTPPVTSITAADLAVLVQRAARAVTVTRHRSRQPRRRRRSRCCGSAPKPTPSHWSRARGTGSGEVTPVRSGRSVAAYLAKYVTKSVAEFGVGIRRMSPLAVAELDVSAHVRAILTTITDLAAHRAYEGMDRWLHTLGYRGHITTKSRLFSTTMGALRAYRATWTRQQHTDQAATTKDAEHRRATPTIDAIEWEFDRVGLCSLGERVLILSAAQRMIEHRHTVRDHLRAHDPPAHPDWLT